MANIVWMQKQFELLFEKHGKKCPCSYCSGSSKLHFGLNLPKDKKWNSWRVIKILGWYIRWNGISVTTASYRNIKEGLKDFQDRAKTHHTTLQSAAPVVPPPSTQICEK